jgi:hypothetical protein
MKDLARHRFHITRKAQLRKTVLKEFHQASSLGLNVC